MTEGTARTSYRYAILIEQQYELDRALHAPGARFARLMPRSRSSLPG
jgi:hypothetical protein